jgi:hypothetical protein
MLQNKQAAIDKAAIDVSKPKLKRFRGNKRDALDRKPGVSRSADWTKFKG